MANGSSHASQSARLAKEYLKEQGALKGASTVTQQLAKNLWLGSERALGRKIEEAVLACADSLVAGSQASGLVAARGHGEALDLLPDARQFALLPPGALTGDVRALYGRAPDAKVSQP